MRFNSENAKTIFQGFEKSPNVLLFTRDDAEITEEIRNVATSVRGEFRFVSVDLDLEENWRLLEFLGITNRGANIKTHHHNLILLFFQFRKICTLYIDRCTFTVENNRISNLSSHEIRG